MVSSLAASLHSGFYWLLEVFDPPEGLASRNFFATFFTSSCKLCALSTAMRTAIRRPVRDFPLLPG
jgi:hypothetical protein